MSPDEIMVCLRRFEGGGAQIAAELADDPELDRSKPLSQALQDVLYDERGLPR